MARTSRKGRAASAMAWAINWWAWGMVKAGLFLPPQAQANEEQVRQRGVRHVAMPRQPGAGFVMIHADFAFPVFQGRLHRPAHPAHTDELAARAGGWGIAEVDLQLGREPQRAAEDHPHARAGQAVAQRGGTQERKLSDQRTLAAFFDSRARPLRLRHTRRQVPHFPRGGGGARHARSRAWATQQPLSRWLNSGCAQPHPRIGGHFHQEPFAQALDSVEKYRALAV